VLLNLFPEHLDWHGSQARYFADKLNLLTRHPAPVTLLNHTDPETRRLNIEVPDPLYFNAPEAIHVGDDGFFQGDRRLFSTRQLPLRGQHNLSNICAALSVVASLGYPLKPLRAALETFRPFPHRLESVACLHGVEYIDDSISTVPEAAIEAVRALGERPLTVLLGGHDRQLDYRRLVRFLIGRAGRVPLTVISMGDSGRRIHRLLDEAMPVEGLSNHYARRLAQAVPLAATLTPAGGVVLLSPAAPSYGEFRSFAERGEMFRKLALDSAV